MELWGDDKDWEAPGSNLKVDEQAFWTSWMWRKRPRGVRMTSDSQPDQEGGWGARERGRATGRRWGLESGLFSVSLLVHTESPARPSPVREPAVFTVGLKSPEASIRGGMGKSQHGQEPRGGEKDKRIHLGDKKLLQEMRI